MQEKEFDFWQEHSLHFLEMAFRTDRRERIESPDGYGTHTRQCGDTVEMFVTIKEGRVETVSYDMRGCLNTNACINAVVELSEGRSVEEARGLSAEEVFNYLETLPGDSYHCAELAMEAFHLALDDGVRTLAEKAASGADRNL